MTEPGWASDRDRSHHLFNLLCFLPVPAPRELLRRSQQCLVASSKAATSFNLAKNIILSTPSVSVATGAGTEHSVTFPAANRFAAPTVETTNETGTAGCVASAQCGVAPQQGPAGTKPRRVSRAAQSFPSPRQPAMNRTERTAKMPSRLLGVQALQQAEHDRRAVIVLATGSPLRGATRRGHHRPARVKLIRRQGC